MTKEDFQRWSQENLANFAWDAYVKMKEQADVIEQLRQDFKDAMKLVRETNYNKDDWK